MNENDVPNSVSFDQPTVEKRSFNHLRCSEASKKYSEDNSTLREKHSMKETGTPPLILIDSPGDTGTSS